jgi:hypothetical protein
MDNVSDQSADSQSSKERVEDYEAPSIVVLGRFEEFTLSASGSTGDGGARRHTS